MSLRETFLRIFHALLALLLAATSNLPIRCAQFEPANPVRLIVNVYLGSLQNRAPAGLTVRLEDRFGSLEQDQKTDSSGRVEFQTLTQTHRLRIYGPGIQETEETVEIEAIESRKMYNVTVRAATTGSDATPVTSPTKTVPANRLKAPEGAEKEFDKGSQSLGKKDWSEAQKRFKAAISIYPDYDVAHNGLGVALMNLGDSTGARGAFEKAIQLNDTFAEAYRNLARIDLNEHHFKEADSSLTRSLQYDPLNAWALTYAAYSELQLKRFDDAIAHAQKAHSLPHAGLASAHVVAALALEAANRPAEAVSEYRTYLREDPEGKDAARARTKIAQLEHQGNN